jgi:beta-glucuronidase
MIKIYVFLIIISSSMMLSGQEMANAQTAMNNVYGRHIINLNGNWKVVIDPFDIGLGDWKAVYKDRKPEGKTDFVEYSFDLGPSLSVPGDFNSQLPELTYYESSVWYKKTFTYALHDNRKLFLHFGAVNYLADVFFNGRNLGRHEGGFTPFQFELTDYVVEGENVIIVRVNNARRKEGIPGIGFDWFNYGGITRDVHLIETPGTFVSDYLVQPEKNDISRITGYIQLNKAVPDQEISVAIPELKIKLTLVTDARGFAPFSQKAKPEPWTPENPKLYSVQLICNGDTISDQIGFRTVQVKGTEILLNGKPIFLKGVNVHEEIPQRKARAYSEADARVLLGWASDLGCNFVRLAHYPHNEHTIRLAEKMGLMVWEEIPVYQGIDFTDPQMKHKMENMLEEMVNRDKNRCNVVIWSMANETSPSRARDETLVALAEKTRALDNTRLISAAFDNVQYEDNKIVLTDTVMKYMDLISVNEYLGWYRTWPASPENMIWENTFDKPLIISEFGGEAVYNNDGIPDVASTWSEDYVEKIYNDQTTMFKNLSFLRGTCPWILADFRSPGRMHPVYQQGWNRKGLLSDRGERKKAWYVMRKFYLER